MKKYIVAVALLLLVCLLFSCSSNGGDENVEGVKMTAIIKSIDNKIEVDVIEGEYGASGIYWVNVSSDTVYLNENGNSILKSSIKVGDTVEITYSGQVMMSYPPQIIALKIQVK